MRIELDPWSNVWGNSKAGKTGGATDFVVFYEEFEGQNSVIIAFIFAGKITTVYYRFKI